MAVEAPGIGEGILGDRLDGEGEGLAHLGKGVGGGGGGDGELTGEFAESEFAILDGGGEGGGDGEDVGIGGVFDDGGEAEAGVGPGLGEACFELGDRASEFLVAGGGEVGAGGGAPRASSV